jgi:hypothetical protein
MVHIYNLFQIDSEGRVVETFSAKFRQSHMIKYGCGKIRHFQGLKMTILSVFEPGFQVVDLKFCPGFR